MKTPYLEDIQSSAEYLFCNYHSDLINKKDYITYIDAFNKMGVVMFKDKWTDREFYARRGYTECINYRISRNLDYEIFKNCHEESSIASKIGNAEYYILTPLMNGTVDSFYFDPHKGEEFPIEPSYWKSQKSNYTRIRARYRAFKEHKPRAAPGSDYLILFKKTDFKKMIKSLPKRKIKTPAPKKADYIKSLETLKNLCMKKQVFLNRERFFSHLNALMESDYFRDSNSRLLWNNDWPEDLKLNRGSKKAKYLETGDLPN